MRFQHSFGWLFAISLLFAGGSSMRADSAGEGRLDLASAVLVLPARMSDPEKAAAQMLVEEVEKRSFQRWPSTGHLPENGQPAIVLGQREAIVRDFPSLAGKLTSEGGYKAEGYQIVSTGSGTVIVAGNDARGVLFGAGRLLRLLDYSREDVILPRKVNIVTAPAYPLRGHQLGYRPKTNAYDGWSLAMYEQYIRDLMIFGTNAIELVPPISDDAPNSPHFTLSPMRMMVELSRLCAKYGIQCWVWYPAMRPHYLSPDYSKLAEVDFALKDWRDVLSQLPRLDAVLVPGGDPGNTPPNLLFPLLEKQAAQLRTFHPETTMWVSPQGFDRKQTDDFYRLVKAQPAWLSGIVYGPWDQDSLEKLRAQIPQRYPIRAYPDITHTFRSHYPVVDWDFAYASTEHREPINPRPVDYTAIFHDIMPVAKLGFITYSEGCNDDVNKFVWSSLGWNPDESVPDIVRDYSHYFIGAEHGEEFAQGLLDLERNWRGPLATNQNVYPTLALFQKLERTATPEMLHNWRFQEGLYRAYYDATDKARLFSDTVAEKNAIDALRKTGTMGSLAAIAKAEKALAASPASLTPPGTDWHAWRARVFELAEGLFQTIHMQLSVPRYQAEAFERAANLDLIDYPLNDLPWMEGRFTEVEALPNEADRLKRIDEIVNWCTRGAVITGPLKTTFHGLDPRGHYKLLITYGSVDNDLSEDPMKVRLVANGKFEIHSMRNPRNDGMTVGWVGTGPIPYTVPDGAVIGGELRLTWTPSRASKNGSGLQVKEVWLIKDRTPNMLLSPYVKTGSPYPR
jgi:hypothetical protein